MRSCLSVLVFVLVFVPVFVPVFFLIGCSPGEDGTSQGSSTESNTTTGSSTGSSSCGDTEGCEDYTYVDWLGNCCGLQDGDLVPLATYVLVLHCYEDEDAPVCGCDGVVYPNECKANLAGFDVDAFASCTPPEGLMPCGYLLCDPAVSYCEATLSEKFPKYGGFECVPLPASCGDPADCSCLADEPCAEMGCVDGAPGLTLTCPGE